MHMVLSFVTKNFPLAVLCLETLLSYMVLSPQLLKWINIFIFFSFLLLGGEASSGNHSQFLAFTLNHKWPGLLSVTAVEALAT